MNQWKVGHLYLDRLKPEYMKNDEWKYLLQKVLYNPANTAH